VQPPWLARLNHWRAMAGLSPVADDSSLSDADFKHARYLVENFRDVIARGGDIGVAGHREDPHRPWYTPEGAAAAENSDVFEGWFARAPSPPSTSAVDWWISGPFHRLPILNPDLNAAGFGTYDKDGCWAAAMDLAPHPHPPQLFERAIEFPPDGTVTSLSWAAGEWPNPLAACPGYSRPAGLPITLQLGWFTDTGLTAHSIVLDGRPIEHCAFDGANYTNPSPFDQEYARKALGGWSAIVLIPRYPLKRGAVYSVSVTARGQTYNWSFKTAAH
jgi:Cysteine-rich secretory protein family